jgi:hypothetical protein
VPPIERSRDSILGGLRTTDVTTLEKRRTSSLSLASSSAASLARSVGRTPKDSKTRRRFLAGSKLVEVRICVLTVDDDGCGEADDWRWPSLGRPRAG